MKPEHQLTSYSRINSKWIKYLNISWDTIKVLVQTQTIKFQISHIVIFFPDVFPRVREIKKNK